MSKQEFVVVDPAVGLYLTQYNIATPSASLFGNAEEAITFETLEEAERIAGQIGGGTVGTTKP